MCWMQHKCMKFDTVVDAIVKTTYMDTQWCNQNENSLAVAPFKFKYLKRVYYKLSVDNYKT